MKEKKTQYDCDDAQEIDINTLWKIIKSNNYFQNEVWKDITLLLTII